MNDELLTPHEISVVVAATDYNFPVEIEIATKICQAQLSKLQAAAALKQDNEAELKQAVEQERERIMLWADEVCPHSDFNDPNLQRKADCYKCWQALKGEQR